MHELPQCRHPVSKGCLRMQQGGVVIDVRPITGKPHFLRSSRLARAAEKSSREVDRSAFAQETLTQTIPTMAPRRKKQRLSEGGTEGATSTTEVEQTPS